MRVGVDIGGTFTDVVVYSDDGGLRSFKAPSTPPRFGDGVLAGIDIAARELGVDRRAFLGAIEEFIHGTTVTTNIVITRSGVRVGLITTRGFADNYPLARQYRGHEQDPARVTHPVPLAALEDIEEVTERVDYAGNIVVPIREDELKSAVARLVEKGIESIAVSFLWSFRNSAHEMRAKELVLDQLPGGYVSASYEAAPISGEYERTSTTVINAYAGPLLERYARQLDEDLRQGGLSKSILIMKSDGGPASIETAVTRAAQTVYSGPTAGVVASGALGKALGEENLITFDMGGTSTDVALVNQGEPQTTSMQFLDRQAFAAPMIDITSVGAGGGSIASIAPGGNLKVGPESAGAVPGPVCYDRGGTEPTVTDANVVLGLISPDAFLGGDLQLDKAKAEASIAKLGDTLGMDLERTAFGMIRVANAVMADAIRLRTVYAGHDPREYTLLSFGGAGGLHCASVAAELGIRRIVVPRMASVFSALGLLASDLTYSYAKSAMVVLGPRGQGDVTQIGTANETFGELSRNAHDELDKQEIPEDRRTFLHSVEMSYAGQILNMEVEVPAHDLEQADLVDLCARFDERYINLYGPGAAVPEAGYMLRTFKVVGSGKIALNPYLRDGGSKSGKDPEPLEPKGRRSALANTETGEISELAVYDGEATLSGHRFSGPCILEYSDTNVLVPRGFEAVCDWLRNIIIEQEPTIG